MNTILVITIVSIWIVHAEDSDVINRCMQLWIRDADGKVKCVDCERCPTGHASYPPCHKNKIWDATTSKGCKRCRHGTFQQFNESTVECQICSSCLPHYKVLKMCTIYNDISCSDECEEGFYKWKAKCLPCCECLSASDNKESQCIGTKSKHCRSKDGGKCKPVAVDPVSTPAIKLVSSIPAIPARSSRVTSLIAVVPSTMINPSTNTQSRRRTPSTRRTPAIGSTSAFRSTPAISMSVATSSVVSSAKLMTTHLSVIKTSVIVATSTALLTVKVSSSNTPLGRNPSTGRLTRAEIVLICVAIVVVFGAICFIVKRRMKKNWIPQRVERRERIPHDPPSLARAEPLTLKIPTKAEILAQKNCIICEETKQGERSTLSEIAAREIVQVEHAALYFGKLSEELSGKNAESIYRTLTGENCTYTGITDTSTLFDGIQTRIPGLTVASFFVALDIIGKRNVARKFHDSFHSDREEILAVNNCIICGGSTPDKTLEKKLAEIDDLESTLMKHLDQYDRLKIYQILLGKKAERNTDLNKEVTSAVGELNIANLFKLLELMGKMAVLPRVHESLHKVITIDP